MKKAKSVIAIGLALSFVIALNVQASASVKDKSKMTGNSITASGIVSLKNPHTKVSGVMTYSQIVEQIKKDNNISEADAAKLVKSNFTDDNLALAERATYRTISEQADLWSNYKPTVKFYCETSEYEEFHGILKILNTSLNRIYNGYAKQFSGTLYTNLEDANTIYWELNGDFYNYGSTTISGGGSISIGGILTITFTASQTDTGYFGTCDYPTETHW